MICGQLENCTLTFVCPLALKDTLGGLQHSLVTNCLKGRCTFIVCISVGNLSNVYRACSFFMISDPFCIDNARVIGWKIR